MNHATFFEKFDQFAIAPHAVAKIRELIMWSAFSGAFSAQERDQPMPDGWAVEGAPTLPAIPSSWKWQRGSDVFDVIRGVSYKKNDASGSPVEGSFPVLRANNIGYGINFDDLVYVPRDNIRDEQFVRRGDILIAMSSGSKKLVGKAAPIVSDFKGAFGAFCGIIRNKSRIPDEVLARYFKTPQYTSWVTAAGRGIGINNLGRGDLDSLPVPTPPLAEQKWIVAKVDELMVLCDRLEAQQQERETRHAALARASLARFADAPNPANLNFIFPKSYDIPPADLRKSILTLAVQGKLVPQDPNDEPAERLISRIGHDRVALETAKEIDHLKICPPVDVSEYPFDVPRNWIWTTLSAIALKLHQGINTAADRVIYKPNGHKILQSKHMTSGEIRHADARCVGEDDFAKYRHKFSPKKSDILFANIGTIGKNMVVRSSEPILIAWNIFLIRLHGDASSEFVKFRLDDLDGTGFYNTLTSGSATKFVSKGNLAAVLIPLPPLAEQRRIVAKVEQLMALVDALETQLAASRATAANLLSALVAELTGTPHTGKVSVPSGTGRRGRPSKSA